MKTSELGTSCHSFLTPADNLAAETAAYMSTVHPGYGELAARIAISNLQKLTSNSFSETIKMEYEYTNPKTGQQAPLVHDDIFKIVMENKEKLDAAIKHERDFYFDYFGFKTLERSYLVRLNGVVVERPQYMYMRVAVGIHQVFMNLVQSLISTRAISTQPLRRTTS